MSDKKISQLPLGVITPESIFPFVTLGITSQSPFTGLVDALNPYFSGGSTEFVNLPTAPTTDINLADGTNISITITGDTNLNFIGQGEGKENNLILNLPIPIHPKVLFSSNIKWDKNDVKLINNLDGILDPYYTDNALGFNDAINILTHQSDGKILVGGSFTTFSGVTQNRLTRLNTDGTLDTSFNIGTGFNSSVTSIEHQSDGKILVGGSFTTFSGVSQNKLTRLNTDGTLDTSFNVGIGFDNSVYKTLTQSDGKVLAGGPFSSFSGVSQNKMIKLNADGTLDTSFNIGTGFNGAVYTFEQQSDGKILVGGDFSTFSGVTQNRLTRLNTDGTLDTSFNVGVGFNNSVTTLALQSDGKILVGGDFSTFSGVSQNKLTRLNTGGTLDISFNIGIGFDTSVTKIIYTTNDKILIGGDFYTYNNSTVDKIVKLNLDGSVDRTFKSKIFYLPPNTNPFPEFNTISIFNNDIFIGGKFIGYDTLVKNNILKLLQNQPKTYYFKLIQQGSDIIIK